MTLWQVLSIDGYLFMGDFLKKVTHNTLSHKELHQSNQSNLFFAPPRDTPQEKYKKIKTEKIKLKKKYLSHVCIYNNMVTLVTIYINIIISTT